MPPPSSSPPDLAEAVPNFKQVTPREKSKLSPLMRHYGKMAHPFTACVRDNRKRFGDRAEGVCAVLKDLIRGTTKWRNTEHAMGALLEAAGGQVDLLVEMYRDDLGRRLDAVIEQTGWEAVVLILYEQGTDPPPVARTRDEELREEIAELAEAYHACPGEPNALTAVIDHAAGLVALAERLATDPKPSKRKPKPLSPSVLTKYPKLTAAPKPKIRERKSTTPVQRARAEVKAAGPKPAAKPTTSGSPQSAGGAAAAARPRGTGDQGGQFISAGSSGGATRAVQKAVGAKVDGQFGEGTAERVQAYQKKHGLVVDGIVGRQTASAILGNRSASKLNVGAITSSQRKRLGGKRKVREEEEILLELSLRSLRGGVRGRRDYDRIGGGHGEKSGRFSKAPVAAIGRPGGRPRLRSVSALHEPTGSLARPKPAAKPAAKISSRGPTADKPKVAKAKAEAKQVVTTAKAKARTALHGTGPEYHRKRETESKAGAAARLRPSVKRRKSDEKATGLGKGAPAKSGFEPGGRGERIGANITEAEEAVVEAVKATPAYKAAVAEMERVNSVQGLIDTPIEEITPRGTFTYFGGKAGMPHRVYSSEIRAALHAEIIKAFTQGTSRPQGSGKADVLFMAGGGASGKSTMLNASGTEPDNAALLNADAIKSCLPEYDALRLNPDDEVAMKAAGAVHEESSDLNKRLIRYAQLSNSNYVVDGTGDNKRGKFIKSLNEAREKGGDVRVMYATTYVEDAVDRAKARFEGKSRRYVHPDILYEAHSGSAQNFLDVWDSDFPVEVYDTSTKPPLLVAVRKSGSGRKSLKINDQEAFDRFLARGGGPEGTGEFLRDRAPASAKPKQKGPRLGAKVAVDRALARADQRSAARKG